MLRICVKLFIFSQRTSTLQLYSNEDILKKNQQERKKLLYYYSYVREKIIYIYTISK